MVSDCLVSCIFMKALIYKKQNGNWSMRSHDMLIYIYPEIPSNSATNDKKLKNANFDIFTVFIYH